MDIGGLANNLVQLYQTNLGAIAPAVNDAARMYEANKTELSWPEFALLIGGLYCLLAAMLVTQKLLSDYHKGKDKTQRNVHAELHGISPVLEGFMRKELLKHREIYSKEGPIDGGFL
jgi:hypothetical protein